MRKYVKYIFCVLMSLTLVVSNVCAEETTKEDTTCNYASKAYLNKLAGSVTASYEFVYDKDGKVSFDISLYNITEEIYISVTPTIGKTVKGESFEIFNSMTEGNKYTFHVDNIEDVITYDFIVRSTKFGCIHDIRKFSLKKPRKNKFHDMNICKYEEVLDFYYCQEWLEIDFALPDSEIEKKIIREKEKNKKTVTTKCVSCENKEKNEIKRNRIILIKMYIIAGLIVGIIIDLVVIVVLIRNIRRSTI